MTETRNEYIDPTNYFEGYNESIQGLKNNPELISFDKLCYEVFEHSDSGKALMEIIDRRFLLPALVDINCNNYQIACIHAEGIKQAFRILKHSVMSHQQRIKAEVNK